MAKSREAKALVLSEAKIKRLLGSVMQNISFVPNSFVYPPIPKAKSTHNGKK
ncbi:hypothetical protein LEP1GSC194_0956 [Leptospira alstonii serovar Sichuan str. 79601]|uniref:Uncharacterized protein n=1 Tax=Leptospira alstonii serovar Sichuan str. 79601 TaxID=1218565 RepID=M6D6P4_9LEPT|nr:hypothetical protein LEP1GSC194_0956 [Leptospira alstonii serovar Sichuan str. 79601]